MSPEHLGSNIWRLNEDEYVKGLSVINGQVQEVIHQGPSIVRVQNHHFTDTQTGEEINLMALQIGNLNLQIIGKDFPEVVKEVKKPE